MDVKEECEEKYGRVDFIKIEKESQVCLLVAPRPWKDAHDLQGEIYVKFDSIEAAKQAVEGLNGRWFGGNQVSAAFISDAIMAAHQ